MRIGHEPGGHHHARGEESAVTVGQTLPPDLPARVD